MWVDVFFLKIDVEFPPWFRCELVVRAALRGNVAFSTFNTLKGYSDLWLKGPSGQSWNQIGSYLLHLFLRKKLVLKYFPGFSEKLYIEAQILLLQDKKNQNKKY